ncbi:MAG: heavy metal sensor histidine kinase [Gemmatimonadetes bacterium]|nr:heavy metal sensor histidine kinase [Gemmatimonadota bacterium]
MYSTKTEAPAPPTAGSWSIAGRLSGINAVKTLIIVAVVGGVLYWGLARELRQQDAKLVASKLSVLEHLVSTYPLTSEAIESEVEHEAGDEGPLRYFLRIVDASGRVALETPGTPPELGVTAFPPFATSTRTTLECAECVMSDDAAYLLASRRTAGLAGAGQIGLQVALDVGRTNGALRRYGWMLAIVLGLGVALSASSTLIIARLAVRPLHEIADQVRAITASRLDLPPLSARPWPTELQGLAGDFDEMLTRLGDAFARLSQFAADLAHALRNPINNLRGSAEVALARTRTADEYQQTLGSSLEELDRLSRLIDGLLFIARSEDPRQAIERSTIAIRHEIDAVRDFYDALAAERGVDVRCDGEATIIGDPMLVRRAVSNLLANALKHTERGDTVELVARERPDGGASVVVRDSGRGIAAQHLPHLFERFYRADDDRTDASGAGLGLAIVRSIMRLHGGEARLESEVGVGTTVTLEFPATRDPRPA